MGKLIALASIGVLALQGNVGRGFSRADTVAPDQFTESEMVSATIMMSRDSYFTVGISGSGVVTYIGSGAVGMAGMLTHQVSQDAARSLVDEFIRAKFFGFEESYRFADYGGYFQSVTHSGETLLTVSIGKVSKSVSMSYGTPNALLELQRRVEDVTDVRRYTGRPPPEVGPYTFSGQVTDTNGSPVAAAVITMPGAVSYEATTDAAGRYRISGVFPGHYALRATADGFVNAVSTTTIAKGGALVDWNPRLESYAGPAPLLDLLRRLNVFAQTTTRSCGHFLLTDEERREADAATLQAFVACAIEASQQSKPVRVVAQRSGFNSWVAQGIFTGDRGDIWFYTFDSCGDAGCKARFRPAKCATPVVSALPSGGATILCENRRDNSR